MANSDEQAIDVWLRVLAATDRSDLIAKIVHMNNQITATRDAILALPEDEDPAHLLAHFPAIESITSDIFLASQVPIRYFGAKVSGEMLYSVQTCVRVLRRNGVKEETLSDEATLELIALVRKLVDEVVGSSLPEELKALLVQRLRDVEDALTFVRISGTSGLTAAMDALLGASMRISQVDPKHREKVGNWFTRLWSSAQSLMEGTSAIAASATDIAEAVKAIAGE